MKSLAVIRSFERMVRSAVGSSSTGRDVARCAEGSTTSPFSVCVCFVPYCAKSRQRGDQPGTVASHGITHC